MDKILILGYGNADREDDGVAWHVLAQVAGRLERPVPASVDDEFENPGPPPDLLFVLQLTPEHGELISEYDRVCLVDAHTGAVPQEVNLVPVDPEFQSSPFTHHLTANSLLAISAALYSHTPEAILVSVRGYAFGFSRQLSPQTSLLVPQAVGAILDWIGQP